MFASSTSQATPSGKAVSKICRLWFKPTKHKTANRQIRQRKKHLSKLSMIIFVSLRCWGTQKRKKNSGYMFYHFLTFRAASMETADPEKSLSPFAKLLVLFKIYRDLRLFLLTQSVFIFIFFEYWHWCPFDDAIATVFITLTSILSHLEEHFRSYSGTETWLLTANNISFQHFTDHEASANHTEKRCYFFPTV